MLKWMLVTTTAGFLFFASFKGSAEPLCMPFKKLPPHTFLKNLDNGIRLIEFTENLPDTFPVEKSFSGWLTWQLGNEQQESNFLFRAIDLHQTIPTPYGTYCLLIKSITKAKRYGKKEEGLLVFLSLEPSLKGVWQYPFPPEIQTAEAKGILSDFQQNTILTIRQEYERKCAIISRLWKEFSQSTYLMYSRNQLLTGLTGLYALPSGFAADALDPYKFFDRKQRIQLRREDLRIDRPFQVYIQNNELILSIQGSPLSQIIESWNSNSFFRPALSFPGLEKLQATPDRKHEEIDLSLKMRVTGEEEALKICQGILKNLKGVIPLQP